jgi:Reverse transcriptase (RNA-dependent DNA polymerase)
VKHSDPLSPLLFTIVIDAVVREAKRLQELIHSATIFDADDGLITGTNKEHLQQYLTTICELSKKNGLKINFNKTKILVS